MFTEHRAYSIKCELGYRMENVQKIFFEVVYAKAGRLGSRTEAGSRVKFGTEAEKTRKIEAEAELRQTFVGSDQKLYDAHIGRFGPQLSAIRPVKIIERLGSFGHLNRSRRPRPRTTATIEAEAEFSQIWFVP